MYSSLIPITPYNFYLRILTARYLRIKMIDAKNLLLNLQDLDNEQFIEEINKYYVEAKEIASDKSIMNTHRGTFIKIVKHFNIIATSYLDFGCGNGLITQSIAKLLNVKADGIDILPDSKNINYYLYNGNVLPNTKMYDLITINQVLHHIEMKDINIILPQLVDKLLPGGRLLLKEHDCYNDNIKLLIELQHDYYSQRSTHMPVLSLNNKSYWKYLFERLGLIYISEYVEEKDPTASFYIMFEKSNVALPDINSSESEEYSEFVS